MYFFLKTENCCVRRLPYGVVLLAGTVYMVDGTLTTVCTVESKNSVLVPYEKALFIDLAYYPHKTSTFYVDYCTSYY